MTKAASRRPSRHKKEDRLRFPTTSAEERHCDMLMAPVTRAWDDADDAWGFETILGLLPAAWVDRYAALRIKLDDAYDRADVDACRDLAPRMVGAIRAMQDGLIAAGHQPTRPEVWWVEADDGKRIGFVRHADQIARAMRDNPGATICTAREAVVALKPALFGLLSETKRLFPGAEMTAIRPRTELEEELDDEIVF